MTDDDEFSGDGTTEVAVAARKGRVVLSFPRAVQWLKLEPQQAIELAGGMIRAGLEAKTGKTPTDAVVSRLMGDVKKEISKEHVNALVNRVINMRRTMDSEKRSTLFQATAIVERILTDTKGFR